MDVDKGNSSQNNLPDDGKLPPRSARHQNKKSAAHFFHFSSAMEESDDATSQETDTQPSAIFDLATEEGRSALRSDYTAKQQSTDDDGNHTLKKKKRRRLNPAFGFLLLLLMLCSGAYCGYAAMRAILPPVYDESGLDQEMLHNINILALGCDEREGDSAARADVIMLATIRPEAKQISIFSIPRDTRVEIEGHGQDKINHSMAYGGIPLVQKSVENLLNIKIDHTVKVNFDGFINVIDALGGVNIDVPCRMYKPLEAIDLQEGYQTLNGSEALAFVRWRGDGTGDYGRIERQQQFLTAVTQKLKDMNLKQALDVTGALMDSIETDMSIKEMTSYGVNLLGISADNFKTYSFVGTPVWIHGVSYVEPDMTAIADIVDKMQHGEQTAEPTTDEPTAADPAAPTTAA